MCTVLLPPGFNPIAVKYHISYHIYIIYNTIYYNIIYHILYHTISYRIISYKIKYGMWKSGGAIPLTFNFEIRWKWEVSFTHRTPYPHPPLPSGVSPTSERKAFEERKMSPACSESNNISCLIQPVSQSLYQLSSLGLWLHSLIL
jgi:hypothetical protein